MAGVGKAAAALYELGPKAPLLRALGPEEQVAAQAHQEVWRPTVHNVKAYGHHPTLSAPGCRGGCRQLSGAPARIHSMTTWTCSGGSNWAMGI